MAIAPADLDPAALPRRFRGYDPGQVERLLAGLRAGYEATRAERASLAKRLATLEARADEMAGLERDLRATLLEAQRAVVARRRQAEAEAEALVARARAAAAEATAGLDEERERAAAEIERLYELDREFRAAARQLVEEALAQLGSVADDEPLALRAPEAPVPPATVAEPEEAEPLAEEASAPPAPPPASDLRAAVAPPSIDDDTLPFSPIVEPLELEPPPEFPEPRRAAPAPQPEPELAPLEPVAAPEAPVAPEPAEARPSARRRWRAYLVSLGILLVGAGIAIGIWQLADGSAASPADVVTAASDQPTASSATTTPAAPASETTAPAATTAGAAAPTGEATTDGEPAEPPPAEPPLARLALRSQGGDAWVQVRAGSAGGELLFEGFLYDGEARRFSKRRLWVRIGDPTHLVVWLNGKRVRNLPAGTANVAVTAAGVRTLSLG
jgi:cell division septum initiation protein DivIVA